MKLTFEKIEAEDRQAVEGLSALASAIVKEHFDPIIGPEQNDYMIRRAQSVPAILEQLAAGARYDLVRDESGTAIGFLAYYPEEGQMYLSKFYLEKTARGHGYARQMLAFLIEQTRQAGLLSIFLHCNRHNNALLAYEGLGFVKTGEMVTEIGEGFVMDDFVYTYYLPPDKPR